MIRFPIAGTNQNYEETNALKQNVIVGQVWLHEPNTNIVQITELDSYDSDIADKERQNVFNNVCSYVNNDRFKVDSDFEEEKCKINNKARDKRRLRNKIFNNVPMSPTDSDTGIHVTDFTHTRRNIKKANQQVNCFTIINKHYVINSDSSTDSEIYTKDQKHNLPEHYECSSNKNTSFDESLTYEHNMDRDKHTILIYSFKNKHLFSENNSETMNISINESSSTSNSIENIGNNLKEIPLDSSRIPTPIPGTYVPRLNLSIPPSLPNVTEVTESKYPSNETIKSDWKIRKKSINSWFTDISAYAREKIIDNEENSEKLNIINWMALSPREKRRTSKASVPRSNLAPVIESNFEFVTNKKTENINGNDVEFSRKHDNIYTVERIPVKNENFKVSFEEKNDTDDRGDHDEHKYLRKPQIKCTPKTIKNFSEITEPIEKLDSSKWIIHNRLTSQDKNIDCNLDNIDIINNSEAQNEISASYRLWNNNMSLLKPAEWSEYFPMVDSVPSINLSFDIDSLEEQSCISRLVRCFQCCKWLKI
ncbi:uncharacterized protein MAL13P1.304-like [Galleria mellonella]|uniref:Uncharacterized protein MAL13P1.304-like n=1 Tax=Galleria mellonella TaxID=7137 RepID=A0ABM3MMH7_GALME|nr:uncharacterized protein MAL13P1.304-like [Galleria mellonella]